jgi:ASC-1-like (ASCH) protein
MKFCDECGNKLSRSVETGEVIFTCICTKTFKGTTRDVLLLEEQFETHKSNLKFDTFIENSAYDDTNKRILRDCSNCKRNYMTLIRIGEQSKIMFTCVCGIRETADGVIHGAAQLEGDIINPNTPNTPTNTIEYLSGDVVGASQVYRCNMQSKWFKELQSGNKTSIGIVDEINPNDILFVKSDTGDILKLLINNVSKFNSLKDYLEQAGIESVLPGITNIEEGLEILERDFDSVKIHSDDIYGATFTSVANVMKMHAPWLSEVISGKKTVDVRIGGERFNKWVAGDTVVLFNDDEHAVVKIVDVSHYKTLAQLFKSVKVEELFPGVKAQTKAKQILSQWITPAQIRKHGLVSIKFNLQ